MWQKCMCPGVPFKHRVLVQCFPECPRPKHYENAKYVTHWNSRIEKFLKSNTQLKSSIKIKISPNYSGAPFCRQQLFLVSRRTSLLLDPFLHQSYWRWTTDAGLTCDSVQSPWSTSILQINSTRLVTFMNTVFHKTAVLILAICRIFFYLRKVK